MSNFYKYFKENMSALGLPAPESLFGTVQTTEALRSRLDVVSATAPRSAMSLSRPRNGDSGDHGLPRFFIGYQAFTTLA